MNELTTAINEVAYFAPVPEHPGLFSDTTELARMLMDPAWAEVGEFIRDRVSIQLGTGIVDQAPPLVLEPDAVHDPLRLLDAPLIELMARKAVNA